jgi:WD40 repeat protein
VLSWPEDKTLRVWELESGQSQILTGHQGRVNGALLLPDGRGLSSAGRNRASLSAIARWSPA